METITPPNFKGRAAIIFAEIRIRACIDEDAEVIKELLQDALEEYYRIGYDDGHSEGRSYGYDAGHYDGYDDALCGIVAYKRPRQP